MPDAGYYRHPTIHGDTIVFGCEEDLWTVPACGGVARRLTSGRGAALHPALSPDGRLLAFTGREEGPSEVFVMPVEGGQPRRLTFLGAVATVISWTPDGRIVFVTPAGQPFNAMSRPWAVSPDGGSPEALPTGPANFVSSGRGKALVLGRNQVDPAYWKRYRGGTAGDLWIDANGSGRFRRLIQLDGNPTRPLWVGGRIFFLCDHEGVGNLYSCLPSGKGLRRHTRHEDFYARHCASDGRRIVYQAGGDLYLFDPATNATRRVDIVWHSPRTQRNRRFVSAAKHLENYGLHPQGHYLALTCRGKVCTMGNWEGPAPQLGEPHTGRYRLAAYLHDGKRVVAVSDAEGQETLTIHRTDAPSAPQRLEGLDLGRVVALKPSPKADQLLLTNVRSELVLVDLEKKQARVLDRSPFGPIAGFDFSPDGKWAAYSASATLHTRVIKLCRLEDGATFNATRPVLADVEPSFDPEGKHLYFLSSREFNPVYDRMHFDLSFPRGMRPYLITLRKDLPNPFQPVPRPLEEAKKDEDKGKKPGGGAVGLAADAGATADAASAQHQREGGAAAAKPTEAGVPGPTGEQPLVIDLDGIEDRVLAFPVAEGIYDQIAGIKGKVLFTSLPVEGALAQSWYPCAEPPAKATLTCWDFENHKAETLVDKLTSFDLSLDRKALVYRAGNTLRVLKAGAKPDNDADALPRKTGWIDLDRVRLSVDPPAEWRQMYGEAWRLQREQYWREDLAEVDWRLIYQRYLPLLERVSSRDEFTDLLWEMQGELGSSHAYVMGGDVREEPRYDLGLLGADVAWDAKARLWRIAHIVAGDPWDAEKSSALSRPGLNVKVGDTILAVNGRGTSADVSPAQLLVNQAGLEVALTVGDDKGQDPRTVAVKTLKQEMPLRYREWVERNRQYVHDKTKGRCGYLHIPDMGPRGYAEFHRYFLAEVDRDALVVDVRFNGGGHVSQLLLEKLARKRLAYVHSRWFGVEPWPADSPGGPMVALTNEFAGSDGDIFSHNFKALGLGPLLGKRTWGGVIGIWPRHTLVDGGLTTQPEFSFWFRDIGWKVENYGVDPDLEVEFPPHDHVAGKDPQLDRAIAEVTKLLRKAKPGLPKFEKSPSRKLPRGLKR